MHNKRFLAALLSLIMLLSLMPLQFHAEEQAPPAQDEVILLGGASQEVEDLHLPPSLPLPEEPPVFPVEPGLEEAAVEAPEAEEPAAEEPEAEEPAADEPAAEKPEAEEPAAEEPVAEKPEAEEPAAEEPAAEEPAAEEPETEEPAVEEPAVEEPAAEEPAVEEPAAEDPTVEEPAAEEPAAEEAEAEEPAVEEPETEEPAVEEPAVEEPPVEEPAVEEPAVEEPVAEKPIAEEPAAEEPAAEEPVAEEPAPDAPADEPLETEQETQPATDQQIQSALAVTASNDQASYEYQGVITTSYEITGGMPPYRAAYRWLIADADNIEREYGAMDWNTSPAANSVSSDVPAGVRGRFYIQVFDSEDAFAEFYTPDFIITGVPQPLTADIVLSADSVNYGEQITASWDISGGTPPYNVSGRWTYWESENTSRDFGISQDEIDAGVATLTAPAGIKGQFNLDVWDEDGRYQRVDSQVFPIVGAPEPLMADVTLNGDAFNYGDQITVTWVITGGTPPYDISGHMHYTLSDGGNTNTDYMYGEEGAEGSLTTRVRSGERAYFALWVRDSMGQHVEYDSPTFTITGSPEPLSVILTNEADEAVYQHSFTSSWSITGGVAPYTLQYWWQILDANNSNSSYGHGTSTAAQGSDSLIVPNGIEGTFNVSIEDADGNTLWWSTPPFTITGAPEPPQISVTTNKTDYAYQEQMTASWEVTGGIAPYDVGIQWYITDEHDNVTVYYSPSSDQPQGSVSLNAPIGTSGYVEATVVDGEGFWVGIYSAPFTITGAPAPLQVTLTNDQSAYAFQAPVTSTWAITGGVAPYTVEYSLWADPGEVNWHIIEGGTSEQAEGSTTYPAPNGQKGTFHVTVTDAEGNTLSRQSDAYTITGAPGPLAITAQNDQDTYAYQDIITSTYAITGGVAPYSVSYSWSVDDAEGGGRTYGHKFLENTPAQNSVSLMAPAGVRGDFTIDVWDAEGAIAYTATSPFTITGSPEPLVVTLSLGQSTVNYGENIDVSWEVTGGAGGYTLYYSWWIAQPGLDFEHLMGYESTQAPGSATLKAPIGERGYLSVYAEDADGNSAYAESAEFTILNSPEPITGSITLSTTQATYGEDIIANWQVEGGVAPYRIETDLFISRDDGNEYTWVSDSRSDQAAGSAQFRVPMGTKGFIALNVWDADNNRFSKYSDDFTITGSPEPITIQLEVTPTTLNYRDTFTYTWAVTGGVPGYSIEAVLVTVDSQGMHSARFLGTLSEAAGSAQAQAGLGVRTYVQLSVTDAEGNTDWQDSGDITILGAPDPIQADITLSTMEAVYQQDITASWSITGGTPPYSIKYEWISWPEEGWGTQFAQGTSAQAAGSDIQQVPSGARGSFELTVTDAHGMVSNHSEFFTITGSPPPYSPTVSLSATTVAYRDTITATWDITGGEDSFTGHAYWEVTDANGLTQAVEWINLRGNRTGESTITVPAGEQGNFTVVVNGRYGGWYETSQSFTITGSPQPLEAAITLDKTSVPFGGDITASWAITGGVQPYEIVRTNWTIFYDWEYENQFGVEYPIAGSGSDSLTVPGGTSGQFEVFVNDAEGNRAQFYSEVFTITGSPPPILSEYSLNAHVITAGDTLTVDWQIEGGTPPYSLDLEWNIYEADEQGDVVKRAFYQDAYSNKATGSSSRQINFGSYVEVNAKITDSRGETRYDWVGYADILGEPRHDFLTAQLTVDSDKIYYPGDTLTASYQFAGGLAPYTMDYQWYHWQDGGEVVLASGTLSSLSGSLSYQATQAGYPSLRVSVQDATGVINSDSAYFTVLDVPRPKVTAQDGAIKLDWAAVQDASKYKVSQFENGAYTTLSDNVTELTYTITGLTNGTAYRFLVQAWIDAEEEWTLEADYLLVTGTPKPAIPKPWRPSVKVSKIESLSNTGTTLKLTWARIPGASGYELERALTRNGPWTRVAYTTGTSYTVSRLKAGVRYFFRLRAYDIIDGQRVTSGKNSAVYASIPVGTTAITGAQSISTSRIKLTWRKAPGATKYQIFIGRSPKGPFSPFRKTFATSITLTNLKPGTYYFYIRPYHRLYTTSYYGPVSKVRVARTLLK